MSTGFKRTFRLDRTSRTQLRESIDDEFSHHFELVVDELTSAGWTQENARAEAMRQFGDMDETRAYCEEMQTRRGRDERRRKMMSFEEVTQDLRYALRSVRKSRGYATIVVLTLAFGIAANTTMFSVMNPYLFRSLPYGQPEQLVHVNQVNPTTGWDMDRFSYPQYVDWTVRSEALSDVAAYVYGAANVTDREGPEQVQFARVTANLFDVLDAAPAMGRTFAADEGGPGGAPVVVLSDGIWQRRYAADPATIGRAITIDGVQHTVIGVMPPAFNFPFGGIRMWVPTRDDVTSNRQSNQYALVGRLQPGWTSERAHAELSSIQSELAAEFPDTDAHMSGVTVKPLREALNFAWDQLSVLFFVLLGAVAFVLLIACANVASLTLARGASRVREVSVRAAMGAARGRIVRQLLMESLVLAAAGGVLGVGLAYWTTGLIDPLIPEDLFKIGGITIDGTVLSFTVLVTLATPLAFGLVPALRASRADLTVGLKEASKGSGGVDASRGRRLLVVTQVAMAVVLITGAGLMLRSFASVQSIDLGFDSNRVVTAEIVLGSAEYPTGEERRTFMAEAVAAALRVPGTTDASAVRWLPLNHETMSRQYATAEGLGRPADEWPLATSNFIYPGYFATMGIDLLEGREFTTLDDVDGQGVVIVNDVLAAQQWPGENAVGQSITVGGPDDGVVLSVVGVVSGVQHEDLNPRSGISQLYRPALQTASGRFFLLSRTSSDPSSLIPGLRGALLAVAPNLPPTIRPMDDVVAENQLQWSLSSVFLGIFGAGALLLAALGIYGLIAYSVSQRQREIGVRIALGATAREIRREIVGDGMRLTGIGLVLGLVVALGFGQLVSSILYGVSATDPLTIVVVFAIFLSVAGAASLLPAARASATDPIVALRSE